MKLKILLIIIVIFIGTAIYGYVNYTREIDLGGQTVSIIIKSGNTLGETARQLVDSGIVESKIMLVYPARFLGIDKKLIPGRYDFTGKNSCRSVLNRLKRADFYKIKFTIPEGSTIWQTAGIIARNMDLDSSVIVALNNDTAFLKQYDLPQLEGYLFPETYFFAWNSNEKDILDAMIKMFHNQTDSIWPQNIIADMTRSDIIKIASIIEAETGHGDERQLVSSVYHNRLKNKMKLDADPTVIYGLGGLDRPLYIKDLKKQTPYNTYLNKGLPPTPINSPGLEAIKAALFPDSTDYYFFVADKSGRHVFSRTNAEHNRAKNKIRSNNNN